MAVKKQRLSTREVIENAEKIFHGIRWKYGIVVCPYCGSMNICEHEGYHYKCNSCKKRFSDRTKTLMHGSKLSIKVWMQAIYEMFTDNFISSITLSKKLGINQKSAWLLQTKLRYAMDMDKYILNGIIAQDEMYVGGCLSNYHYERKLRLLRSKGLLEEDRRDYTKSAIYALNSELKQPVFGMNDGNNVVLYATPNPIKKEYIHYIYKKHTTGEDNVVVSDESKLYDNWEEITGSKLSTNNHHNNQYTTEEGYTSNRIENTFSWFKRGFGARITHCKYYQFYLNEFCFRYNNRHRTHKERFELILGDTIGKTITYKDIKAYKQYYGFKTKKQYKRHIYTMSEIEDMLKYSCVEYVQIGETKYYRKDFIK